MEWTLTYVDDNRWIDDWCIKLPTVKTFHGTVSIRSKHGTGTELHITFLVNLMVKVLIVKNINNSIWKFRGSFVKF